MKNLMSKYLSQIEKETQSNEIGREVSPAEQFMYVEAAQAAAPMMNNCMTAVREADAYSVTITNGSSVASAKAVLFGTYANSNPTITPRYGSDVNISVTPDSGSSYFAFLQQAMANPFTIYSWRIEANTSAQLNQPLFVVYTNAATGNSARVNIQLSIRRNLFYPGNGQYAMEFIKTINVDGNTQFEVNMLPSGVMTISMFANAVADMKQALANTGTASIAKRFETPVLSYLPTVNANNVIGQQ